jgi:hypothetical protein
MRRKENHILAFACQKLIQNKLGNVFFFMLDNVHISILNKTIHRDNEKEQRELCGLYGLIYF